MSGPERIWLGCTAGEIGGVSYEMDCWAAHYELEDGAEWIEGPHEYVRRDRAVLAALPEVQALVAAETERCAKIADPPLMHRKGKPGLWRKRRAAIAAAIREGRKDG